MPRRRAVWGRARRPVTTCDRGWSASCRRYLVAVVVILTLLPDADHPSLTVWLANLSLTQIYVPLTLTAG